MAGSFESAFGKSGVDFPAAKLVAVVSTAVALLLYWNSEVLRKDLEAARAEAAAAAVRQVEAAFMPPRNVLVRINEVDYYLMEGVCPAPPQPSAVEL